MMAYKRAKRRVKVSVIKKPRWRLVDAKSPITIVITKHDVTTSRKKDPGHCAAAVALSRVYHTEARVYISKTYIKQKDRWVRYATPEALRREITAFDRSSAFEPGEYRLVPVSPSAQLGKKQGGSQTKTHQTTRPKRHITTQIREHAPRGMAVPQ